VTKNGASRWNKNRAATFSLRRRSLSAAKSKLNRPHRGEAFSQSPDWRSYTFGPRQLQGNPEITYCRVLPVGLHPEKIDRRRQRVGFAKLRQQRPLKRFAGTAGAPPAMSAKRENGFPPKDCAPAPRLRAGRPRSQQIAWVVKPLSAPQDHSQKVEPGILVP